jgi:glycosyltransferase involved in cell wall biosynthesis
VKILVVLTYYWPHRTGLTLHVQHLSEALAARGHAVTVLTSRFLDALPARERLNGVDVIRLTSALRISRGQVMPSLPAEAARLIQQHDVVALHSPLLELPLLGALARRHDRALVVTHHGDLVLPSGPMNRFIEFVVRRFFLRGARGADQLVAYSDDYARHSSYLAPFAGRWTAIYPPVRLPVPGGSARERTRARLGVGDAPLIGYAGRFVEEKRPDLILRALPHLDERLPRAHVAFAGQFMLPYERFYERTLPLIERYRSRAHFLGLIQDDQELADFYAACDVLVLPSSTECFGIVQVEAMLSGTPVVTTDVPGVREPVRVTGMGRIVPPRDTQALAAAIADVITRRETYVRPRSAILERFNLDRTVDEYEAVLQAAVERRRVPAAGEERTIASAS